MQPVSPFQFFPTYDCAEEWLLVTASGFCWHRDPQGAGKWPDTL